MSLRVFALCFAALAFVSAAGCTRHQVQVDPIKTEHVVEVRPMEMTINVNIRLVDKALNNFFEDIDQERMEMVPSAGVSSENNDAGKE
ncbi:MAG: hypothetical protein ACLFRG_23225 [Desulfococcaceae bacterium]